MKKEFIANTKTYNKLGVILQSKSLNLKTSEQMMTLPY